MPRPRTLVALVILSSSAALAGTPAKPVTPAPRPAPVADSKADPALLDLRAKLNSMFAKEAEKQLPRFRPLCDADGYPLVGNINNKGSMMQPSALCATVRARIAKQ